MHGHLILCLVVSSFVLVVHLIYILLLQILVNFDSYNKGFLTRPETIPLTMRSRINFPLLEYQIHIYLPILAVKQHRMRWQLLDRPFIRSQFF